MQKVVLLLAVVLGRPAVAQKLAKPAPRQSVAATVQSGLATWRSHHVGAEDLGGLFALIHIKATGLYSDRERQWRADGERLRRAMIEELLSPTLARNQTYGIGDLGNPPQREPEWLMLGDFKKKQ